MNASVSIQKTVLDLAAWFESFFSDIEVYGDDLSGLVVFDGKKPGALTQDSRAKMQVRAVQFLHEHALPDGTGAVFSRAATGSEEGILEWWARDPDRGFARITFGTNPTGDRFYDYERLEWFETAFGAKKRAIAGPYIDYLGIEEYIVTCMTPLTIAGEVVGVVGCDIRMGDLERALMPMLLRIPGDAAILNPHGNVLVGNSGHFLSGDRVTSAPDGYAITPLEIASMELSLLHVA
jgi:hypothetical protein